MSMYIYNIVVKWANGDLEGFGASGLSKESAYERALKKARDKAATMTNGGHEVLTHSAYAELTIDEQDEIQRDWDSSQL